MRVVTERAPRLGPAQIAPNPTLCHIFDRARLPPPAMDAPAEAQQPAAAAAPPAPAAAPPAPGPPPAPAAAAGAPPVDDAPARKRRRARWEAERADARAWELRRRVADLSVDAELLGREAAAARADLHVALPPLAAVPVAERDALAAARARRVADILAGACRRALTALTTHKWSWPFNAPVDLAQYPDYLAAVPDPIDFTAIRRRLDTGAYGAPAGFAADVRRVFENARAYNKPGSDVHVMANTLQERFEERFAREVVPRVAEEAAVAAAEEAAARRRAAGPGGAPAPRAAAGPARAAAEARAAALVRAADELQALVGDAKAAAAACCAAAPASRAEKEALLAALRRLSQAQFEAAVGIVLHHHPGLAPFGDVAFDLDQLDALSLRQVASFAAACETAEAARRRAGGTGAKAGSAAAAWPGVAGGAGAPAARRRPAPPPAPPAAEGGGAAGDATPAAAPGAAIAGGTPVPSSAALESHNLVAALPAAAP